MIFKMSLTEQFMNFPLLRTTCLLFLLAKAASGSTDQITLKNKDVFYGKVVALGDGTIDLETAHSATPLKVRNEGLANLKFGETATDDFPKDGQVLRLLNGDAFPGEVIALDAEHLEFRTWFAGDLKIPRTLIDSVLFGVAPQRTIYEGPNSLEEWTVSDDGDWNFSKQVLRSRDRGSLGKKFDLTESFIFQSTIRWVNSPNVRIHLCVDRSKLENQGNSNSYQIYINNSGVQVRRVMPPESERETYLTLISHQVNLQQMRGKKLVIDLRVDRQSGSIILYLDGKKVQSVVDPEKPPMGDAVVFESLNSGNGDTQIEEISVLEWDAQTQNLRREGRAEDEKDTLSITDGDRFSGQVREFLSNEPEKRFVVEIPQSPEALEVPLSLCTVIYFTKNADLPESVGEYSLQLRTGGRITLSGINLNEKALLANHPWLGKMEISRAVMKSITKAP